MRRIPTGLAAAGTLWIALTLMPHGVLGGEIGDPSGKGPFLLAGTQTKAPAAPSPEKPAPKKPRLVVLPLQPGEGQTYDGTGLAVHFLLGNIVALHTGFREFWFGWRVHRIFPEKESLEAYFRGQGPPLDISAHAREQGIRYWIEGRYQRQGPHIRVTLSLVDAEPGGERRSTELTLAPGNRVLAFCEAFLGWLADCGHPIPDAQRAKALWPEEISAKGLDLLGRAMEYYYLHVSYKEPGPLEMRLFDQAAAAAPGSYLTHDFRAWGLYRIKDYPGAEKAFKSALQVNPNGIGAVSGLMWCAIYTGRRDEAMRWAEAKAELRGEDREKARRFVAKKMEKRSPKSGIESGPGSLLLKPWNPGLPP